MNSSNKILANTVILYIKIIVTILLALWTVPIALRALGESDYGLYNLVAGIIVMLAFLNNSMTVVTQRYMSVTMGSKNLEKLNAVYNASIRIHVILAIIIAFGFEIAYPFLFNGFLNIEPNRVQAAKIVYHCLVVSTFCSMIAVPFQATLNAYENMLVLSLVGILDAILKLLLAFSLLNMTVDRLVAYGIGMASISILFTIISFLYVKFKYLDLYIDFNAHIEKRLFHGMLAYAGWTTFGTVAMIGKNQGISLILNLFKGTAINASYGIANQINGAVSHFTSSIQQAVSPQLMQREGANDRQSVIVMSFSLVKIATIIYGLMAIPLILEINQVLELWLQDNIPSYTAHFCKLILLCQLIFQFSSGVALSIDAVGKIKVYRIILSLVLILNVPFAYIILKMGNEPYFVLYTMVIVEVLCLIVRLLFAKKLVGYSIKDYLFSCLFPLAFVLSLSYLGGSLFISFTSPSFCRLLGTISLTMIIALVCSYYCVLTAKEKQVIDSFIRSIVRK